MIRLRHGWRRRVQVMCMVFMVWSLLCVHSPLGFATEAPSSAVAPPLAILAAARAHVTGKIGEAFFTNYLTLEECRYWPGDVESGQARDVSPDGKSRRGAKPRQPLPPSVGPKGPYWSVSYRLRMPAKPWVQGSVSLAVDSSGTLVSPGGIYGICDCVQHPSACDFSVNESTAVEAARRAGFSPGVRPWTARFQWVAIIPVPCYEWVISNTLHLQADSCSGDGESLVIDAGTTEVLTKSNLMWTCDFIPRADALPAEGEFVYYEEEPVPLTRVEPTYDEYAREAGITGEVLLRVLVGRDGLVKGAKVVRGVTGLNVAALEAVKKWVFKPALSNNKPVAVWIDIPIRFPP